MFNLRASKASFLSSASFLLLALSGAAHAVGFSDDFEGLAPTGYTRTSGTTGTGSARLSLPGEPALGNTSFRLNIGTQDSFSRVSYTSTSGPIGNLRSLSGTFQTYLDPSSDVALTPYFLLGVDSNKNGVYESAIDALVIQFSSLNGNSPAKGTWLTEGFNANSAVHVQVNRGMLPASGDNNFQPDETPDFLSELYDTNYDATTKWGDLNVLFARVGLGSFAVGTTQQGITAYVDNVSVQAVPEPTTMAALGFGALGLLRSRRKRA